MRETYGISLISFREYFRFRLHIIKLDSSLIYLSKLKILIKKKNHTWTYMNATARRIDNLFVKSGIVFWHLPVITAQPPEAARGNAQSLRCFC